MIDRPARKSKTPSRYDVYASLSDDGEPTPKPSEATCRQRRCC
jgi:hypothetical protein